MTFSPAVDLVLFSILFPFALMGITEAVVKPIAVKVTQYGVRQFVNRTFYLLDERLQLPGQWEQFIKDKTNYLKNIVIPEVDGVEELTEAQIQQVLDVIPKEFNLETFLNKVEN